MSSALSHLKSGTEEVIKLRRKIVLYLPCAIYVCNLVGDVEINVYYKTKLDY